MVFDAYARYYDLLYQDKDYRAESEYVVSHIRAYAPQAKRILELGCGTGAHAEHLTRMGYVVHGVDVSETMLARAESRRKRLPAELSTRLSFGRADVRTVRTGESHDVVISLFHVLSYQTTDDGLRAMFETAFTHLVPSGLFIFDFWYGPAVLAQRPEVRVKHLEDEIIEVTRIAEPALHLNENVVDVNYSVLIKEKATGKVEQVRESHRMRYLFLPELERYRGARFEERASHEWMTGEPMSERSWAGCQVLARV
jgi:SAM-dependent methyltransferase